MLKNLVLVLSILIIVAVAFFVINLDNSVTSLDNKEQLLLSKVKGDLSKISSIEIISNKESTHLIKEKNNWLVKEKYNYNSDIKKIRRIIHNLSLSVLKEKKTSIVSNYNKLGLDSENSTRLILLSENNHLLDIYFGKHSSHLRGTYIRFEEDKQTWLASGYFSIPKSPEGWLDNNLFSIKKERIRSIEIKSSNSKPLVIAKNDIGEKNFHLKGKFYNKKVISQYEVNNIPYSLAKLEFKDIKPLSDISFRGREVVKAVLRTFDGLEITVLLLEKDNKKWVSFKMAFKEFLINKEEKTKKDKVVFLATSDDIKQMIKELSPKLSKLTFAISDYDYKKLTSKVDSLLESSKK